MIAAARVAAAIEVLDAVLAGESAEKTLTHWGRTHRFAGSGDRAAIRDLVFDGLRGWRSLAALGGSDSGRGIMIGLLRRAGQDPALIFTGVGHAPASLSAQDAPQSDLSDPILADLPDWLFPTFSADLGPRAAEVLCALQSRASIFLRVNLRRGTVAKAMESLAAEQIDARTVPDIKTALQVISNERKIVASTAYLSGLVELQDAASQQAVLRLPLADGQRVLDYCAGGGGKALAMAALTDVTVFAHDAAPRRMVDLLRRADRAGVTIAQVSTEKLDTLPLFDLVLADAPCSGSGTWRRTPDAKWRFDLADLTRLVALQADILARACHHVAAGGVLAYATCSVLRAENQAQVQNFLRTRPDFRLVNDWQDLPTQNGDGFYLGLLQRR